MTGFRIANIARSQQRPALDTPVLNIFDRDESKYVRTGFAAISVTLAWPSFVMISASHRGRQLRSGQGAGSAGTLAFFSTPE
jgi:hypothetical protein